MNYSFISPALSELDEAAYYYEKQVEGPGGEFLREVDSAIDRICSFPEAWGKISEHYRHCLLQRFPYAIIYSFIEPDSVIIYSVFHQSREPSSWKSNL